MVPMVVLMPQFAEGVQSFSALSEPAVTTVCGDPSADGLDGRFNATIFRRSAVILGSTRTVKCGYVLLAGCCHTASQYLNCECSVILCRKCGILNGEKLKYGNLGKKWCAAKIRSDFTRQPRLVGSLLGCFWGVNGNFDSVVHGSPLKPIKLTLRSNFY